MVVPPLDVFAVIKNREPRCSGSAETVAEAIELIRKAGSGSYFVFSRRTGHRDFYEVTTSNGVCLMWARVCRFGAMKTQD